MIKFFRHIRKKLLGEGKTGRYFKYAVGEILLVVIGILIALQINNWNEARKSLIHEKKTIKSLKLEFEKNLEKIEVNIKDLQAIKSTGELLLKHTGPNYKNGTLNNVDSLISITPRMSVWDPSLYTLTTIKNSGELSTLSNEKLKLLLIDWETFYGNLEDWSEFYIQGGNRYFTYLETHAINRNIIGKLRLNIGDSKFIGSNEQLLRTQSFESILVNRVSVNTFMLRYYQEAKKTLTDIIKQCETYK